MLFETIRIENGSICNLRYHNERMNRSRNILFGVTDTVDLETLVAVPEEYSRGPAKCRVTYTHKLLNIEFGQYEPRKILSLKVVCCDSIDYGFKFSDRTAIDNLFRLRGSCDDILIVKNGLVTDASFANVVFFDGRRWITPASPLLRGTKRQQLIEEGMVTEEEIRGSDTNLFSRVSLINAMRDPDWESRIEVVP